MSLPPITEDHRSRRFADGYDRVFAKVERTYLGPIRSRLVGPLTGRIVEIGAGTGANIQHYASAELVELVEPFPRMREQLVRRLEAREGGIPMRAVDGRAEELPFADASVDAVVSTLVLCSVRDLPRALAEVRRVLAPGGVFAYLEHSRGRGLKRVVQTAITPRASAKSVDGAVTCENVVAGRRVACGGRGAGGDDWGSYTLLVAGSPTPPCHLPLLLPGRASRCLRCSLMCPTRVNRGACVMACRWC